MLFAKFIRLHIDQHHNITYCSNKIIFIPLYLWNRLKKRKLKKVTNHKMYLCLSEVIVTRGTLIIFYKSISVDHIYRIWCIMGILN